MTSGSDTEFHRRRIYVDGLPPKISSSEVRSIFEPCGTVNYVHLARAGSNGFVTFEEEDAALRALDMHGSTFRDDFILTVQPESEAAMPLPIVAMKRDIHFPKPALGRGTLPQYKISNNLSHRSVSCASTQSSSSRSQRQGSRGQRLERRSSFPNVKILQVSEFETVSCGFADGFPDRYKRLFSLVNFPHVAYNIFMNLDTVSLQRCRLVCRDWAFNIDRFITNLPHFKQKLMDNWRQSNCSIYPLTPELSDLAMISSGSESRYRNILSFKVDEKEIILAVDNGNIEIYDRFSRKLTCLLIGQYSASPVKIDANNNLIFVQYTCAFANSRRRQTPSCWWNVYCRKTKRQLRSIDRDNAGPSIDIKLHLDDMIYLVTQSNIYAIDVFESRLQMSKVLSVAEDRIQAFEFTSINQAVIIFKREESLFLSVWKDCGGEMRCQKSFQIYQESRCQCMSMQVKNHIVMSLLSNNGGSYEYLGGKPYVLIMFHDLTTEKCLRLLRLDSEWMNRMSAALVPFDGESCLNTARFSQHHLAVGFGSFSDRKDGAIAIWSMSDLLNGDQEEELLPMWTIPAPIYHWGSWDGHIGGVNCLHLDAFGLVASNACKHHLHTRCIEREDEARKDNLLIYDFWQPGVDLRRPQVT